MIANTEPPSPPTLRTFDEKVVFFNAVFSPILGVLKKKLLLVADFCGHVVDPLPFCRHFRKQYVLFYASLNCH